MDFSKIKKLVKQNGDKFIFLEEGEPEFVVLSFHEYEKITGMRASQEREIYSRRPQFSGAADEEMRRESGDMLRAHLNSSGVPVRLEDIHIEDLPL